MWRCSTTCLQSVQCQAVNCVHLCSTLSPIKTMRQRRLAQQGSQDDLPQEAEELPVILEDQELPSGFWGEHSAVLCFMPCMARSPAPLHYAVIACNYMLRVRGGRRRYTVSRLGMVLETWSSMAATVMGRIFPSPLLK